jgi:hypothetical protein
VTSALQKHFWTSPGAARSFARALPQPEDPREKPPIARFQTFP